MIDVNVYVIDFGITSSDEFVRKNEDGSYTIAINARQATNRQKEAYRHALEHIYREDFDSGLTAAEIECKRMEEEKCQKRKSSRRDRGGAAFK